MDLFNDNGTFTFFSYPSPLCHLPDNRLEVNFVSGEDYEPLPTVQVTHEVGPPTRRRSWGRM